MRRRALYTEGAFRFGDKSLTFNCIVRNLSHCGVGLVMHDINVILTVFVLRLDTSGHMRRCELRWRAGSLVGAEFLDDEELDCTPPWFESGLH